MNHRHKWGESTGHFTFVFTKFHPPFSLGLRMLGELSFVAEVVEILDTLFLLPCTIQLLFLVATYSVPWTCSVAGECCRSSLGK